MFYLLLEHPVSSFSIHQRWNGLSPRKFIYNTLQVISDALRTHKREQDTKELELQSDSGPLYEQYLVLNAELFTALPAIQYETYDFKFLTSSYPGWVFIIMCYTNSVSVNYLMIKL